MSSMKIINGEITYSNASEYYTIDLASINPYSVVDPITGEILLNQPTSEYKAKSLLIAIETLFKSILKKHCYE